MFFSHGDFFSRSFFFSHGMHGIHGNAVAAPACHSELVSPTNFTNVYRYAMVFYLPQITQITLIFFFWFFATFKILFCLGKSLTYNKIRSFAAQKSLYGFTQIFIAARYLLDILEELGRCAARDFVIWCFSHGYLFSHGIHGTHGIFLFQNSLFDFVKCARRNSRKRRGCAGVPFGISISHKFHKCLSLRDRFYLPQIPPIKRKVQCWGEGWNGVRVIISVSYVSVERKTKSAVGVHFVLILC